jgi:hypothetical protein
MEDAAPQKDVKEGKFGRTCHLDLDYVWRDSA